MTEKDKEVLEPDSIDKEIAVPENGMKELVSDDDLLGMYEDAISLIEKDRKQTDEVLENFINMVMNEGDGSSASKEAICKLLELKLKAVDSFTKIADLKTRIKLKEQNTFPAYLAQHNTYNLGGANSNKRQLLMKEIDKKRKKPNDK